MTDQYSPVRDMKEWRAQMDEAAKKSTPSFFHAKAQLPKEGRTNVVLGATPLMSVVLKTYASGGENELHAHPYEDHLFVVMQGSAYFFGPEGEERLIKKNDCVLLPRGSYYWFHANEDDDPLVMLRIGATVGEGQDPLDRIDIEGRAFDGYSEANKEIPVVLSDAWFE